MKSLTNSIFVNLKTNVRQMNNDYQRQISNIMVSIVELKKQQIAKPDNFAIAQKLFEYKNKLFELKDKLKSDNQAQRTLYETCRKRTHLDNRLLKNQTNKKIAENAQQQAANPALNQDYLHEQKNQSCQQSYLSLNIETIKFQREILHYLICKQGAQKAQAYLNKLINSSLVDKSFLFEPQFSLIKRGVKILEEIQNNELTELKKWCFEHSHYLTKIQSSLQFNLLVYEYNCMIAEHKMKMNALQYLRNKLPQIYVSVANKQKVSSLTMRLLSDDQDDEVIVHQTQPRRQIKQKIRRRQNKARQFIPEIDENQQLGEKIDIPIQLFKKTEVYNQRKIKEASQKSYQLDYHSIIETRRKKQQRNRNKEEIYYYQRQNKNLFIAAFENIYRISLDQMLTSFIGTGIKVLKTKYCCQQENKLPFLIRQQFIKKKQVNRKTRKCPICTQSLADLSRSFPMINCQQTSLICRINGSLMDNQSNYPLLLPSRQIYSSSGLQGTQKNGKHFCLISNRYFKKQLTRRVYII